MQIVLGIRKSLRTCVGFGIALAGSALLTSAFAQESVGYDSVRPYGGSGAVYTLSPRALDKDLFIGGGSISLMVGPEWINDSQSDAQFAGGYLRETAQATKSLKGMEFWASIGMSQGYVVRADSVSWIQNTGDFTGGFKYGWNASETFSLAPYVHMRLLSPVEDESIYGDSFSPEFGLAVGWYGTRAENPKAINVYANFAYDYDRTGRLLSDATKESHPPTPFERVLWQMSEYPWLKARVAIEAATGLGGITLEALTSFALIEDNVGPANAHHSAVLSWRKPWFRDWILGTVYASAGVPTEFDSGMYENAPYEVGFQINFASGTLRASGASGAQEESDADLTEAEEVAETRKQRKAREKAEREAAEAAAAAEAARKAEEEFLANPVSAVSEPVAGEEALDAKEATEAAEPAEPVSKAEPKPKPVDAPKPQPVQPAEPEPQDDGSESIDDGSESLGEDGSESLGDEDFDSLYGDEESLYD